MSGSFMGYSHSISGFILFYERRKKKDLKALIEEDKDTISSQFLVMIYTLVTKVDKVVRIFKGANRHINKKVEKPSAKTETTFTIF